MSAAETLERLQLLGRAWVTTLTCLTSDQWQLCIQSGPSWRERFAYTYRGSLASVITRAYAGEPDDAQCRPPALEEMTAIGGPDA